MPLRDEMNRHARAAKVVNDITQQAYLLCLENEEEYEGDFDAFYKIMENRATTGDWEKTQTLEATSMTESPDLEKDYFTEVTPEDILKSKQSLDELLSYAENDKDKMIFALIWEGHKIDEIAFLCRVSRQAVHKRLRKYKGIK